MVMAMCRSEKRRKRRVLQCRIAVLQELVQDPVAKETGCNITALSGKLLRVRRELRRLNY